MGSTKCWEIEYPKKPDMRSGESDLVLRLGGEQGSVLTTLFLFVTHLNALPSTGFFYPVSGRV